MIPLLAPIFRGELAHLGEGLQYARTPPAGAVRVADLLHSVSRLAEVLRMNARFRRHVDADQRAVASAWTLRYVEVLLPPVVAAASMLHHVFPLSAEQTWVRLDGNGGVIDFHIVELGESRRGAPTAERYAPLLWQHLAPLFGSLTGLTRIAPKILWGSVSRHLEPILDQGLRLSGGSASIAQDRAWLLHEADWPCADTGVNPLHGVRREVMRRHEGRDIPLRLHRQCCLYHLLPGEGYCGACPLAPQHRKDGTEEAAEQERDR
ncbi:ferric iron reductase protein FhuF [Variovorax boronicumulans]|uniref:siderophore-iron reductase FhuF n=1 Tax=Variovorax boronicumulans TaxID=436515 RepID=UPI0027825981|nr:siderophore-iron reductase FhuF [Variovorax boronicumulans]MDP9989729.1 ferric iron reductase protein FhuF [Variovorax boronicumulans]MDQ0005625.1 ferric iron reductase protein FhuF [Variovorax boronicumulans]